MRDRSAGQKKWLEKRVLVDEFVEHPTTGALIPLSAQEIAAKRKFLASHYVRLAQAEGLFGECMSGYSDDTVRPSGSTRKASTGWNT